MKCLYMFVFIAIHLIVLVQADEIVPPPENKEMTTTIVAVPLDTNGKDTPIDNNPGEASPGETNGEAAPTVPTTSSSVTTSESPSVTTTVPMTSTSNQETTETPATTVTETPATTVTETPATTVTETPATTTTETLAAMITETPAATIKPEGPKINMIYIGIAGMCLFLAIIFLVLIILLSCHKICAILDELDDIENGEETKE